ncbi:MAG: FAD-dependent oxidoreductase [Desulfofustis sp.]|nr:FAD-dependent oxidoreductase [Desulfofustis sp.]
MSVYDYDIGVIGAGAAGLTVAAGSAQLGAKTLLVEKDDLLGGDCLHYGCVPSKTLIKSAAVYHLSGRMKEFGLPEVNRPPVDFAKVRERIEQTIARIQHHDSVERFTGLGADVRFGRAHFVDDHKVDVGGTELTAGKWVICTGSSAIIPEVPGLSDIGALTNRTIFSLETLPQSLLVVGAGPIGIEMAQAFARLGTTVTVLQRGPQILPREDADLADDLQRMLEDEGIRFMLDCELLSAGADRHGKNLICRTADGAEQLLVGDQVLVGAGRQVNVRELKLENASVAYGTGGIQVDRRLRTSSRHIFAAGDVIGGYQFTHAAGYEGGIVVTNAVMGIPRKTSYRWMPHCTYSDPELGGIGLSEKEAKRLGIAYEAVQERFSDNDRAQAEAETRGGIKLILDKRGRPLGVRILGFHAGDLLAEWVAALNGRVKLSTIAGSIHAYPTMSEINKRAVGSLFSKKIFSDTVRKVLRMVYRYRG